MISRMKKVKCVDLGDHHCDYVAEGEHFEKIRDLIYEHGSIHHREEFNKMNKREKIILDNKIRELANNEAIGEEEFQK